MTEICFIDYPTETITEGQTKLLVPKLKAFTKSSSEYAPSKAPVFYNPVMELNRDIAVLALQAHQKIVGRVINVCEPLAGCGIRGVRFAAEMQGLKKVVVNDISEKAVQMAKHNVHLNKLEKRIIVKNKDANLLLSMYGAPHRRFDAIDVDPFGSPVPYLDSAIRALRNHGLLALTATDMAPLCGVHPKACIRKYGGKPLRTEYCHELAVRLLAGCLASTAAKHDIGVSLVFSHSADHYIRVYATIEYGAKKADESIKNLGYVLHCFNCFHRKTVRKHPLVDLSEKCEKCKSKIDYAGPLWLGKLFEKQFCSLIRKQAEQRPLKHKDKILKTLDLVDNEADAPITYYVIDKFCSKLALPTTSVKQLFRVLKEIEFQVSLTHFNTKGIRTNAPVAVIKRILQERPLKERENQGS